MTVRLLGVDDIRAYLTHMLEVDQDSGQDGIHFTSHSADEPYDLDAAVEREQRRWTTPVTGDHWRRAWGWFVDGAQVGHLYLHGGMMPSARHRVSMGMGVHRDHRRKGGGSALLKASVDWASDQPGIDWVDLGVFEGNAPAEALYRGFGFEEVGRKRDRFRVDGHRLHNISMTLFVGSS